MTINKLHKYLLKVFIPVLLVCFSLSLKAQSAYHGGKGDGYASAEIQNVVLNINPALPQTQVIQLYPNPAKTSQDLQIMMPQSGSFQVEIINLLGQVIFRQFYEAGKANIPLSVCQPGSYIINIQNGNCNYVRKLVIVSP